MRSLRDTPQSQRYLLIYQPFVGGALDEINDNVEKSLDKYKNKEFPYDPIKAYQSVDLSQKVVFFSIHAYADIPIGQEYHILFSLKDNVVIKEVSFKLEHVLFCLACLIPVGAIEHGHKHVLVFDGPLENLKGIPTENSFMDIFSKQHSFGLCHIDDWPHIQGARLKNDT